MSKPKYSDFHKKTMFENFSHLFDDDGKLDNLIKALEEFTNTYEKPKHWRIISCWIGNKRVSEKYIVDDKTYRCYLN